MAGNIAHVTVAEIATFQPFDKKKIHQISAISATEAWVGGGGDSDIALLSTTTQEIKRTSFPHTDFVTLKNGDHIATVLMGQNYLQTVRRITPDGSNNLIASTAPLFPAFISRTRADDSAILISVVEDLTPSSRRLVQRMALNGEVLKTYEFREDGTTNMFKFPTKMAENTNTDICIVNCTGEDRGQLIVLSRDGNLRFIYDGQEPDSKFDPSDVDCDTYGNITVSDSTNKRLHLLSADGKFQQYVLCDLEDSPTCISLSHDVLWVGFQNGTVKAYQYKFKFSSG